MKTRNYLSSLALIVTTALLSACSADGDTQDNTGTNSNFPQDGVMRFATSVSDATQTRAGWDSDNITKNTLYLWVHPQGETEGSDYIYNGILLKYQSHESWTTYANFDAFATNTPITLLWKNKTTKVDIVASNFGGGTGGGALSESAHVSIYNKLLTESDITSYDLVYFKGTVNPAATEDTKAEDGNISEYALMDGKIRLPLRHICSKLTINLSLGTEFNTTTDGLGFSTLNPLSEVKVGGTYTGRYFNMTTGTFTDGNPIGLLDIALSQGKDGEDGYQSAGKWNSVTLATQNATASYECILIPQTVAAGTFTISFTLGGKEYQWTSANAVTFDSGKAYTLALTVGKDATIVSGISAKAWETGTPGNNGNLETE